MTNGTTTISPGIYPSISVSGNGTVLMQPGTYVIKGGGISVTGSGRLEDDSPGDGQGAFIFNACSDFPLASGSCGGISITGNGDIKLEKDTSGTYAGLSIWQLCENTQTLQAAGSSNHKGGQSGDHSGNFQTSGTIYLPCAQVSASANGELEVANGQIVADTFSVTGNAQLQVKWESDVSGVIHIPAVVE